jgi:MOSC domain-containing protein YiiM
VRVVSVNVSGARQVSVQGRTVATGIFKEPIDGRVAVTKLTLEGDRQVDQRAHGGLDKAVYAYPHEHYVTWAEEEDRDDFSFGQFGENLTTEGLLETEVCIGDRFRIGSALFEVTQPRVPCFKLGIKMGDPGFPKRFLASKRCGWYFRVIEEGEVGAGDSIERVVEQPDRISIDDLYTFRYFDPSDRETLERAIALDALSAEWRRELGGI